VTKKREAFAVDLELLANPEALGTTGNFKAVPESAMKPISQALAIIVRQMEVSGNRPITIQGYQRNVKSFQEYAQIKYLEEISNELIYGWLESMDVSNQSKLTRLKCLKAFLSRCFDNGWIDRKYWKPITIKVDKVVKKATSDKDLATFVSLLDLSTYVGYRDYVAVMVLYHCGLRIKTLSNLKESHVNLHTKELDITGDIMKNHKPLMLPLSDSLANMLSLLMMQNKKIRQEYRKSNSYLFLTRLGDPIMENTKSNAIGKMLDRYSRQYGLKNLNPHALRRAFATNLLKKGCDVALISKALGHSGLQVTTQYLDLEIEEVSQGLRVYL